MDSNSGQTGHLSPPMSKRWRVWGCSRMCEVVYDLHVHGDSCSVQRGRRRTLAAGRKACSICAWRSLDNSFPSFSCLGQLSASDVLSPTSMSLIEGYRYRPIPPNSKSFPRGLFNISSARFLIICVVGGICFSVRASIYRKSSSSWTLFRRWRKFASARETVRPLWRRRSVVGYIPKSFAAAALFNFS